MFSRCSSLSLVTKTELWTASMVSTAALISSDPRGEGGGGEGMKREGILGRKGRVTCGLTAFISVGMWTWRGGCGRPEGEEGIVRGGE
jgi:hypothetical protein